MIIRPDRPVVLFCEAIIDYDGRAKSFLEKGNYLVIIKYDQSIFIHLGEKLTPVNYMSAGSKITYENNILTAKRKNETISIKISKIHHYYEPENWSYNERTTSKTESTLRENMIVNIDKYFQHIIEIIKEYKTPVGSVDLVVKDINNFNIIELKRGKSSLNACTQVLRYAEYFNERKYNYRCYIASPEIGENALKFAKSHNITWIKIEHV